MFAELGSAFGQRWMRSYGGQRIAEIMAVWERELRRVPDESIRGGIARAIASDDGKVPTLGQFRAMCIESARARAQSGSSDAPAIPDNSERTLAWRACISRYARRVARSSLAGVSSYTGSFPVDEVVACAEVPASDSAADHDRAFEALRRVFDEEWNLRTNGDREVAS